VKWSGGRLLLVLMTMPFLAHADRIIHREQSLYSQIVVKQDGAVVCLQFHVRSRLRNQTCTNKKRPKEMIFAYTRMMMTTLLFTPQPRNILIVGLGGGTLPMAFADLFPQVEIDSIEIDPAIVKVAKTHFGFVPSKRNRVHVLDARAWVRRAALKAEREYDIIILDAFNGEYIPEHLMTREFFIDLKQMLAPTGVLASNTFTISYLYDYESVTYASVFGNFINFRTAQSANRVILAPQIELSNEVLRTRANEIDASLKPYKVPIRRYARQLLSARTKQPDWNQNVRPLSDQYSPANLLQGR